MGRRSRKRVDRLADETSDTVATLVRDEDGVDAHDDDASTSRREKPRRARTPRPAPRSRRLEDRPPAPWDPFPLSELLVLMALVLGVLGFVMWGSKGPVMITCAAVLGCLGGLDVAVREHFAGYRSHSLLLSATLAVGVIAILFVSHARRDVMLIAGAATLVLAFGGFYRAFRRRAGVGFR